MEPAAARALASFVLHGIASPEIGGDHMDQESLIEQLIAENEEFRRLRTEHQQYDRELESLRGTSPLSADQQWRITELKKQKLHAKDRMEAIIRQHARPRVTA